MSLKIEARPQISRRVLYLTPLLAVALTVVAGFFIFLLMGYNPLLALYHFFISPLTSLYGLSELGVKAAPLIMIGVGLAIGFRANVWNIGAEGQLTVGAIAGGGIALAFWGEAGVWILPLMCLAGLLGGMAYAAIPAFLKTRLGRQRDPDQPDADLRRHAVPQHAGLRALEGPGGLRLPAVAPVHRGSAAADDPGGHAAASRRAGGAAGRGRAPGSS